MFHIIPQSEQILQWSDPLLSGYISISLWRFYLSWFLMVATMVTIYHPNKQPPLVQISLGWPCNLWAPLRNGKTSGAVSGSNLRGTEKRPGPPGWFQIKDGNGECPHFVRWFSQETQFQYTHIYIYPHCHVMFDSRLIMRCELWLNQQLSVYQNWGCPKAIDSPRKAWILRWNPNVGVTSKHFHTIHVTKKTG